jgi:hypothetical protein
VLELERAQEKGSGTWVHWQKFEKLRLNPIQPIPDLTMLTSSLFSSAIINYTITQHDADAVTLQFI